MNLTELIISKMMEKRASTNTEKYVPAEYEIERRNAYKLQPYQQRVYDFLTPGGTKHLAFWNLNNKRIANLPILRNEQAQNQATSFTVPGSDAYNLLRKYLIEHGEANWHNFNNPKNPKPNPVVPQIKGKDGKPIDPEHIKAAGRTMVDNSSNNRFGNIG